MKSLFLLDATSAAKKIKAGTITSSELISSCLAQIKKREPQIHAWIHLNPAAAKTQAEDIDQKIAAGADPGFLAGIPVGVKDIFNTYDFPTEMGSPIWKNFTPGNDARVVARLRWEGAVIPGKTVTAEFAVHTPGPTHNPHKHGYMTGTSSSGSAAAIAACMVPVAIGTQTAGSTIRPASYCGIYGMKPSFGLLPRTGMLKTTDTLDTIGFFSRSVSDLELMFETMRVKGQDYPVVNQKVKRVSRKSNRPGRVGLITDSLWVWDKAEIYAKDALLKFASRMDKLDGISVEKVKLPPEFNHIHEIHGTIYDKTLSYYFKDEYRQKRLISPVMYEIISRGNKISIDQYQQALKLQTQIAASLDKIFDKYDAFLTLSTGGEALKGLNSVDRPDSCLIWTFCHVPTINLPAFRGPLDLPFGVQIVAKKYSDYQLLDLAEFLEKSRLFAPKFAA